VNETLDCLIPTSTSTKGDSDIEVHVGAGSSGDRENIHVLSDMVSYASCKLMRPDFLE
jgi:hypothetical protein